MDANDVLLDFWNALRGQAVTHTRLAGNSLLIYVGCEPGDSKGFVIWLGPAWHMSAPEGVLIGSYQAGVAASEGAPEGELDRVGTPLTRLLDEPITALDIDPRSRDLTVTIGSQYLVRTFVDDPGDEDIWHVTDFRRDLSVFAAATAKGLWVRRRYGKRSSRT